MKHLKPSFQRMLVAAKRADAYWVEAAILEFTEQLADRTAELGLSRGELARVLGTSPAYVTKVLRGDNNFTIETMVRLCRKLGCELQLSMKPGEEARVQPATREHGMARALRR